MSNYNGYFDDEAGFFLPLYIDEYTYSYNTDGNQRSKGVSCQNVHGSYTEISQTDYSYDGAGRLVFESTTGNTYQGANYSYDAAGNRTYMCYVESMPIDYEYTYNKNNQLTSETFYFPYAPEERYTTNYTYDENGSQTGRYGYEASSYGYDSRNRQISYQKGNTSAAYTYRPDGLRASKSVTAWNGVITTTHYVWDGANMVYEYDSTAPTNGTSYLYGIGLLSRKNNGYTSIYLFNAHGDVTRIGYIEYVYDAFGNLISSNTSDTNPFRYCGEYYDAETGTYYLRARYYNPRNGRFTTEDTHWNVGNMIYGDDPQDPLGLGIYRPDMAAIIQSSNLCVYCGNNPLMHIDPTGEAWYHWVIGAAVVVLAAAAVVVTAGGATGAILAVAAMSGTAATTAASTAAAGAFIASSVVFGSMVFDAATSSQSIKEFNDKGNWGTVLYTAGAAGAGGLAGYLACRGSENKNIFSNKKLTNQTSTGVSNFQSSKTGIKAAEADFNALNPTNVTTYSNGTKVGYLSDGRTVNIHTGTSTGGPTLEIFDPNTSEKIKIRY